MQYAEVLVDTPTNKGSFFYSIPPELLSDLALGSFVRLQFRQREIDGVVVGFATHLPQGLSREKLRPISRVVMTKSGLSTTLLQLAEWMSGHYLCSMAEAMFTILPPFPQKRQPNAQQEKTTKKALFDIYYINGREDGRWNKFLSAIERTIIQQKQVIVLFPSTTQAKRFLSKIGPRIPNTAFYTADLPKAKRFRVWSRIASGAIDVVIGTRLAVFSPLPSLGLIIVDDETNPGHQESQRPRYHAIEVAEEYARLSGSILISGAELPSLRTFQKIRQKTARRIDIPETSPKATIVDMRAPKTILSPTVEDALANYRKGIIVTTKLGEGAATRCQDCGLAFCCPHCEMPLTLHAGGTLRCHHCGHIKPLPPACPNCHGTSFRRVGVGAERLEAYIAERFPGRQVDRLEANRPLPDQWDYLIATVKLLDTTVTAPVVAVSSLDTILELPDPFAVERVAQLLVQLRSRAKKEFFVQTRLPDHRVFRVLNHPDYFLDEELTRRKLSRYPPAVTLVRLLLAGTNQVKIAARLTKLAEAIKAGVSPQFISVLGPGPAFYEKIKGRYRWHLLLKIFGGGKKTREKLMSLIPDDIQIDVNPKDIL